MSPALTLRDRVVRDLWWVITSPGLTDERDGAVVEAFDAAALRPLFEALDAESGPLHRAVAGSLRAERLRLGVYFEELVRFFVAHVAGYRDVVSGVVIRDQKRTVGELDLLFRRGESCHHWELAVKFYLHVPGLAASPRDCFVGPQTRDRLHLKLARVWDHQLPLASHAAAAETLAAWRPLHSAALLRGRLFYPASSDWAASVVGAGLEPSHPRGWWCSVGDTEERLPAADAYALLSRRGWLAPVDADLDALTPWSRDELHAWAREAAATWPPGEVRTQVVAGLDSSGCELHRGFLVSVGWPQL